MPIRPLKILSEQNLEIVIQELKILFEGREEILLALLFGSLAEMSGRGKYGDIDIGLYFRPEKLKESPWAIAGRMEADIFKALSNRVLSFPPHPKWPFSMKRRCIFS